MIYKKFFGFTEEPFGVTPNPKFLYMSKRHEDALAHLNFGISENKGFVMFTGEIGSGKTTLVRYLLDNLGPDTHTSLIINPMVDPLDLLKLINHDFGVVCEGFSQKDHLDALNNFLLEVFSRNEKAVLVIDEAQELSLESLEFIRLLSNLETDTRKLLQVILVGQPELKNIVSSEPLRQLDQRVAIRYHLEPLDINDTIIYINHRLKIAGGGVVAFPVNGIKLIHKFSHGIPRLINLVCDRALLLSFSEDKKRIDTVTVRNAVKELGYFDHREKGFFSSGRDLLKPAIISLAVLFAVLIAAYGNISLETGYLDSMTGMFDKHKAEGGFFIVDGIYMSSNPERSEAASILNLLSIWEEKGLHGNIDIKKEVEKRGYSVYSLSNNIDKAIKFNMPCILHLREDTTKELRHDSERSVVLRWVVGNEALLLSPIDGKNILPLTGFQNNVKEVKLLYKNIFNSDDGISTLQEELRKLGFYKGPVNGQLGDKTKKALLRFQEMTGLAKTGTLDDETLIVLSGTKDTPKLTP